MASEEAVEVARTAVNQNRIEMVRMEKEFDRKIFEMRRVFNDLHAELITNNAKTSNLTQELGVSVQGLDVKIARNNESSTATGEKLTNEVEDLKLKLAKGQDESQAMGDKMKQLEHRLERQSEREQLMAQKLQQLEKSWFCLG